MTPFSAEVNIQHFFYKLSVGRVYMHGRLAANKKAMCTAAMQTAFSFTHSRCAARRNDYMHGRVHNIRKILQIFIVMSNAHTKGMALFRGDRG